MQHKTQLYPMSMSEHCSRQSWTVLKPLLRRGAFSDWQRNADAGARAGHPVTHRIALHPNFHVLHSKVTSNLNATTMMAATRWGTWLRSASMQRAALG